MDFFCDIVQADEMVILCEVTSTSPSNTPSSLPSLQPTLDPSSSPSLIPTITPTLIPSITPSLYPSKSPSLSPSQIPSSFPTITPSIIISDEPTLEPSSIPSSYPSQIPSFLPSLSPSSNPSITLSTEPSVVPSSNPSLSLIPSDFPSIKPSTSFAPSLAPVYTIVRVQESEPVAYAGFSDRIALASYTTSSGLEIYALSANYNTGVGRITEFTLDGEFSNLYTIDGTTEEMKLGEGLAGDDGVIMICTPDRDNEIGRCFTNEYSQEGFFFQFSGYDQVVGARYGSSAAVNAELEFAVGCSQLLDRGSNVNAGKCTIHDFFGAYINTVNPPDDESVESEKFGLDVRINSNGIFVSSERVTSGVLSGAIFWFDTGGGTTYLSKVVSSNSDTDDLFGNGFDVLDNLLAVGTPYDTSPDGIQCGSVSLYNISPTNQVLTFGRKIWPPTCISDYQFGAYKSIAILPNVILVGSGGLDGWVDVFSTEGDFLYNITSPETETSWGFGKRVVARSFPDSGLSVALIGAPNGPTSGELQGSGYTYILTSAKHFV